MLYSEILDATDNYKHNICFYQKTFWKQLSEEHSAKYSAS
jgi:hypothetical protein